MILFIDNYDSFTYNLVDYIGQIESNIEVVRNDQIKVSDVASLNPEGIIYSPGPGTPDNAGITCDVIQEYYQTIPMFGVCLGFQSIGQVFGANIIRAPYPVHGKTSKISHNSQGVFKNISSPLEATRYHSLIIERESFPDCFNIIAETDDGLIMGIQHKDFPLSGVQFHPESILTPEGFKMLENWINLLPHRH